MERNEAFAIASRIGWLSGIPAGDRNDILSRTELLHFKADEAIYNTGDEPGGLFGSVTGSIKIWLLTPNGEHGFVHIGGPGMWVGEAASVTGRSRRLTISAASDCNVLRLPRARLLGLAEEKPGIWRHIAQLASMNMLLAIDVIDALRREDPVQRVAATLLNLTVHSPPGVIAISVTQSDLGAIARLSRSTVNRALTELNRRGWVRLSYATVEVVDMGSLSVFVRGK